MYIYTYEINPTKTQKIKARFVTSFHRFPGPGRHLPADLRRRKRAAQRELRRAHGGAGAGGKSQGIRLKWHFNKEIIRKSMNIMDKCGKTGEF